MTHVPPFAPAASQSIVAAAVADQARFELERKAYAAGRQAVQLKRRGLPFLALVQRWGSDLQPHNIRAAFNRGVVDA